MTNAPSVRDNIILLSRHVVFISLFVFCLGCSSSFDEKVSSIISHGSDEALVKSAEKKGVQLNISVSPKQPSLSDLVDLTITIVHPSIISIEPPVFGQSVGDFAVRDYSERTRFAPEKDSIQQASPAESTKQGTTTRVIRYKLEPMFSGKHLIRSIPVVFIEKSAQGTDVRDIVQSEPIEVDVISEFGNVSSDLSQVDPMSDPIAPKQSSLLVGILALIIVGVASATVLWIVRNRSKKLLVAPVLSPEEVAQLALSQLIAEELPSRGLVKEFYLRLTGIVRVFIEGKTGLRAPEQTTEEFLRDMRASSRFDGPQASQLQEFLTAADLVKYAGQTPDETTILKSLERAREFIAIRFHETKDAPNRPHFKEVVND
ncbi:MAG: hypothetical protein ACK5PB_17135 [Pirellula sp.]|jgi:hypothetical protein